MTDIGERFESTIADNEEFPKLAKIGKGIADGLPLEDILAGIRITGNLESVLGDEWRKLTDGVDRELSVEMAKTALQSQVSLSDKAFLHCQWGVSLGGLKRRDETIEVYKKLLAELTDDSQWTKAWRAWTFNGIAWSNFLLGHIDEALDAARQANELDGSDSHQGTLANILFEAGQFDESFEILDRLMAKGFDPHPHQELADDERFIALAEKHGIEPTITERQV